MMGCLRRAVCARRVYWYPRPGSARGSPFGAGAIGGKWMAELVEHIVRQRIYDSVYWKTQCFAINAATLCDRAADLTAVGGLQQNQRPTNFLCLLFKLILIAPERGIIELMLHQPYFKYLTALAAVYVRMVYKPLDIYNILEPRLADYRKLRLIERSGEQRLWHMDELIDALLTQERVFHLALPRMPSRIKLQDVGLAPRTLLIAETQKHITTQESHS